jgi:hypothetical protein
MKAVSAGRKPVRVEEMTGRILVDTNVLIYAMLKADLRHN